MPAAASVMMHAISPGLASNAAVNSAGRLRFGVIGKVINKINGFFLAINSH